MVDDDDESQLVSESMDVDIIDVANLARPNVEERSNDSHRSNHTSSVSSTLGSATPTLSRDTTDLFQPDSVAYWSQYVIDSGIKRVKLFSTSNAGTPPSADFEGAYHMNIVEEESNGSNDKTRTSNSSSSNSKKKKQAKPVVVEEEIIFDEQDLYEKQIRERNNDLEGLQELHHTMARLTAMMKDSSNKNALSRAVSRAISDIFDEIIVEVIEDTHFSIVSHPDDFNQGVILNERGADIYGQDGASIRTDSFLCGNSCGRIISSNRYAPHLEKCTGLQGTKFSKSRRSNTD